MDVSPVMCLYALVLLTIYLVKLSHGSVNKVRDNQFAQILQYQNGIKENYSRTSDFNQLLKNDHHQNSPELISYSGKTAEQFDGVNPFPSRFDASLSDISYGSDPFSNVPSLTEDWSMEGSLLSYILNGFGVSAEVRSGVTVAVVVITFMFIILTAPLEQLFKSLTAPLMPFLQLQRAGLNGLNSYKTLLIV